jgi:hypothetical protein
VRQRFVVEPFGIGQTAPAGTQRIEPLAHD